MAAADWDWHCHHHVLVEPRLGTREERIAFIKANKPASEQTLRLRLYQPVKGRLPGLVIQAGRACNEAWRAYDEAGRVYDEALRAYDEAWRAYDEARRAYDEARRAYDEVLRAYDEAGRVYDEAWRAYNEALTAHRTEIEALHAAECPDCPWDGKTIFAKDILETDDGDK